MYKDQIQRGYDFEENGGWRGMDVSNNGRKYDLFEWESNQKYQPDVEVETRYRDEVDQVVSLRYHEQG